MTEARFVRPGVEQITTASRGRYYVWRRERFYSVTTIISAGVPKRQLEPWAAKMTAIAALRHRDKVDTLLDGETIKWGRDGLPKSPGASAAYKFLTGFRNDDRDIKADLGSLVHDTIEAHVLGQPFPDVIGDAAPHMERFSEFLEAYQPEFIAAEAPVFSRSQKYAGTLDFIARFPGLPETSTLPASPTLLVDVKTGKGVYHEVGLQLAAYRYGDTFFGMPDGTEMPVPQVDGCAVLHLRPDFFRLVEVRADEDVFRTFLYCRELLRYDLEISDSVLGEQILPGVAA